MQLSGQLVRKTFGKGSKSEHEGVFLVTPNKEYLVRRREQNPFEVDTSLDALVGKQVKCSGMIRDYILFVDTCDPEV